LPMAGQSCQTEVNQFMVERHKRIKGSMQADQGLPEPARGLVEMAKIRARISIGGDALDSLVQCEVVV
jgi:hypothetical protein